MFSVAQYLNDPNLSFLCLESQRVELYHQGEPCAFVLHFYDSIIHQFLSYFTSSQVFIISLSLIALCLNVSPT